MWFNLQGVPSPRRPIRYYLYLQWMTETDFLPKDHNMYFGKNLIFHQQYFVSAKIRFSVFLHGAKRDRRTTICSQNNKTETLFSLALFGWLWLSKNRNVLWQFCQICSRNRAAIVSAKDSRRHTVNFSSKGDKSATLPLQIQRHIVPRQNSVQTCFCNEDLCNYPCSECVECDEPSAGALLSTPAASFGLAVAFAFFKYLNV